MADYSYDRHVRTPYSEVYEIREAGSRVGRIDLHFASQDVYGTLILDQELDEDRLLKLIEKVDDDLVLSSEMPRQDFLVSVYHGRDVGLYSDDFTREGQAEDGESHEAPAVGTGARRPDS